MNAVTRKDALQDAATRPLGSFDVSDPALYRDQTYFPYFARLRVEDPVHHCPESRFGPYWSVTRWKEILQVETDHATYSSASGGIQIIDQPKDLARPSFIRTDPPKHGEQRKVVQPIVGPGNLANMEAVIRERTCRLLDGLPRNEAFDWVEHVSIELTTMMLATLFDFPFEERRKLTWWSDVAVCDITDPASPVQSEEARFAELKQMAEAMGVLFNERRAMPPRF